MHSYARFWYDGADRLIRTINYGTNTTGFNSGGSEPSAPSSTPDWNTSGYEDRIINATAYNTRGLVDSVTDPLGHVTKYLYDSLGRRYAVIENYDDAVVAWSSTSGRWTVSSGLSASDQDRVTSFVFDGVGNVICQTAHLPATSGENVQVTQYEYGVSSTSGGGNPHPSLITSPSLLKAVHYPDRSTGAPGTGAADVVYYAYNRLGELRSTTDQNGTTHDYTRDDAGRVTADTVSAFGTNIDDRVKRINVAYDSAGRLSTVQSATNTGGTTLANAVEFRYTPLWQVSRIYQDHDGAITLSGSTPSGNTKDVRYTYSDSAESGGNYSRLATMVYPDATTVTSDYGSSGSTDDKISRVTALETTIGPTGTFSGPFLEYHRIGLDMPATVDLVHAGVILDRTLSHDGKRRWGSYTSQDSGVYPGYDRFGRIARHVWADSKLSTHETSTTVPNYPPVVELVYTYDNASNRLTRYDGRPGAKQAGRDWQFDYDHLDRLKEARRGHSGTSWTTDVGGQQWALDMLGNWVNANTDLDGNNTYTDDWEVDARDHNAANELTQRAFTYHDGGEHNVTLPLAYDSAGNLRTESMDGAGTDRTFTHDAWNRLVKVEIGGESPIAIAEYEYNGLHWRTVKRADTAAGGYDGLDQQRVMYYSASWQLLQEDVDEDYLGDAGVNRVCQEFWGLRYIDDAVIRRTYNSGDAGGESDRVFTHLTDAQFSTIAVLDESAMIVERVGYDPYGHARHSWFGDVNGDDSVDTGDSDLIDGAMDKPIGDTDYDADADLNRDGVVDATDAAMIPAGGIKPLPAGWISNPLTTASEDVPAGPDNVLGYCGYVFNAEVELYTVRFRHYHPTLGRWIERDLLGYLDGQNLYALTKSSPVRATDPSGLIATSAPQGERSGKTSSCARPCVQLSLCADARMYMEQMARVDALIVEACESDDPIVQAIMKGEGAVLTAIGAYGVDRVGQALKDAGRELSIRACREAEEARRLGLRLKSANALVDRRLATTIGVAGKCIQVYSQITHARDLIVAARDGELCDGIGAASNLVCDCLPVAGSIIQLGGDVVGGFISNYWEKLAAAETSRKHAGRCSHVKALQNNYKKLLGEALDKCTGNERAIK